MESTLKNFRYRRKIAIK